MAAHTTAPQIQAWLESTKLPVTSVDDALEASIADLVLGRLSASYTVSGWTDTNSTPRLVQDIISALMAVVIYRRAYAEVITDDPNSFPVWLETFAYGLLDQILSGVIDLPGLTPVATEQPTFWPTNLTGTSQQYDAEGSMVGDSEFSEDIKFRMGTKF